MPFRERLLAQDSYGLLLILTLVLFFAMGTLGGNRVGRMFILFLASAVLLFAFRTSAVDPRVQRAAIWLVVVVVVLVGGIALGTTEAWAVGMARGLMAFLSLVALLAVLLRIGRHPVVSGATVLGALCAYLLIGLTFQGLYGLVDVVASDGFFTAPGASSLDLLYFSFVTLTTVGYGDLVAGTDIGRMLAISEALIGQLYLVTVVALVVGNIGARRQPRQRRRD